MKGIGKFFLSVLSLGIIAWIPLEAQKIAKGAHIKFPSDLRVGAEQMQLYLPLLKEEYSDCCKPDFHDRQDSFSRYTEV